MLLKSSYLSEMVLWSIYNRPVSSRLCLDNELTGNSTIKHNPSETIPSPRHGGHGGHCVHTTPEKVFWLRILVLTLFTIEDRF